MKNFRWWRVATALATTTLLVGSAGSVGCGTQCDRNPDQPPVVYRGGTTNRAAGTYVTSGSNGPFLPFPPGRTYRIFHGLGQVPDPPWTWLSFAEHPLDGSADNEGFVQAAGNQVTYEAVTKDYVDVRNDTCSDVRILVKISAPPLVDPGADASAPLAATPESGDAGG